MAQVLSPLRLDAWREPQEERWSYHEGDFQLSGPLSSPPLSPEGAPLAEYASFLPMMDNFKLEEDAQSSQSALRTPLSVPLTRQTSKGARTRSSTSLSPVETSA